MKRDQGAGIPNESSPTNRQNHGGCRGMQMSYGLIKFWNYVVSAAVLHMLHAFVSYRRVLGLH